MSFGKKPKEYIFRLYRRMGTVTRFYVFFLMAFYRLLERGPLLNVMELKDGKVVITVPKKEVACLSCRTTYGSYIGSHCMMCGSDELLGTAD